MIIYLAIFYVAVASLFLIAGYATTPRQRLHLGLFILASMFWPLSLLMVIGVVCAERIGVEFGPATSRYDQGGLARARAAGRLPRHKLLEGASG